VKCPTYSPDFN